MKRWMSLIVLLLLLCGCGNTDTSETETTAPADVQEPQLPLTACDLPEGEWTGLAAMGEDLLLIGEEGLVLLSGRTLDFLARTDGVHSEDALLQVSGDGIAYYDEAACTVRFLDEQLQSIGYLQLQEDVLGGVHLTDAQDALYYCTAEGIRVLDTATGVSRTLCYREGNWLGITESFCDDTVLQCNLEENGRITSLYFSVGSGEILRETENVTFLDSVGALYFCTLQTGSTREWIYGWADTQPRNFWADENARIYPLLEGSAAVAVRYERTGAAIDYVNLKTGKRTASLAETGITEIADMIWLNGSVFFTDGSRLYRWFPKLTAVKDAADYTAFRYTREDPDEEGMQLYVERAQELETLYGVNILLWEDAIQAQPDSYGFTVEYIPENYVQGFAALETAMSHFNEDFFRNAADWTETKTLNIVLVRQISTDSQDTHPDASGIQYLLNGDAYIVLELDEDLERSFYHWLGHIIDIEVLSNSKKLYEWHKVNPSGFEYENAYTTHASKANSKYLSGNRRYFINAFSLSFPVEDRATIFEFAITPGNEECFESKYMQVKLRRICDGIRDAFGLKGESYIWEQYLN